MKFKARLSRTVGVLVVVALIAAPCGANDPSFISMVDPIERVRVNLNPGGAQIGFENVVTGDHPAVALLVDLIDDAPPGDNHKCPNLGSIRFFMADEPVFGVGLLPSHTEGRFELRLYRDGRYVRVVEVDLDRLQEILAMLGVPEDEPILQK